MNKPLLSIITVTFNVIKAGRSRFLKQCIDSVHRQDYQNIEHIIIDGASTDGTVKLLKSYSKKAWIKLLSEKDTGIYNAMNKGLALAKGKYVAFINSDDFYHNKKGISTMVNALEKSDAVFAYSPVVNLNENSKKTEIITPNIKKVFYSIVPNHQTMLLQREAILNIGGFNEGYRCIGDYDLTLRLCLQNFKSIFVADPFVTYRLGGFSEKALYSGLITNEMVQIYLQNYKKIFPISPETAEILASDLFDGNLADLPNEFAEALEGSNYFDQKEYAEAISARLLANQQIELHVTEEVNKVEQSPVIPAVPLTKRLFPVNSLQRRILSKIIRILKNTISDLKRKAKRRTHDRHSKKLVYIGHSYHSKTKSTGFLIEYLKEHYDLTVVLDDSWNGKPYPDLSFIDGTYVGVVIFQNIPELEVLNSINNNNIIYFPMYDGVVVKGEEYWKQYKQVRVVNFSSSADKIFKKLGFDSLYIQYFPKPYKFSPGEKNTMFFWQRITKINIDIVKKIIGNQKMQIHMHTAIDPYQELLMPDKEIEKKFTMTFSSWFKTRESSLDIIKKKAFYFAPREFEGIGLSFIEALAMGKAVISVDNPTMNEYIVHNETGYLYNFDSLQKIDLSHQTQIQKNAYEYMTKGYHKWESGKYKIIDFIKNK